ncbi:SusC/RagA family TonB-linked outer membrane protein [Echinicola sediminis]
MLLLNVVLAHKIEAQKIDEVYVSVSFEKEKLINVLKEIERQSDFHFTLQEKENYLRERISVDYSKVSVEKLLLDISRQTGLSFQQVNNNISLRKFRPESSKKSLEPIRLEIIGKVLSGGDGMPLPGVTVKVKGTQTGSITDIEGRYHVKADPYDTLLFSFIGFETHSEPIENRVEINVTLEESALGMKEVVVTALGIKKDKAKLGYAIQEVKGDVLTKARDANAMGSLTGRVAGLQISNTPDLFGDPKIRLRGKQPLIVVDGVPINSDSWNLSPDDIESISVLKGPTAAALYGSRGRDGAIQITTKRGASNGNPFTVEINSSTQFQNGFIAIPDVQHVYGPGNYGKYAFGDGPRGEGGINYYDYNIWGPKLNGQLIPQWDSPIDPETGKRIATPFLPKGKDNLTNFMREGLLNTNNVTVASNHDKGNIRFSLSNTYQKGLVPNTDLKTYNFNLSGLQKLGEKVWVDANINYNRQETDNYPNVNYGPRSFIYNLLIWQGSHYDVRDLQDYWLPGQEGIQQKNVEYFQYNNPYFVAYEQTRGYYKDDMYGYLRLNFDITENLKAHIRNYTSFTYLNRQNKYPLSTMEYRPWTYVGGFEETYDKYLENNIDFLISYQKQLSQNFEISATGGSNFRYLNSENLYARTDGGLNVPGVYTLQNSVLPFSPTNFKSHKQVLSFYGTLDLNYKSFLFLGMTGRWDKSSSLPISKNAYFYPSISGSVLVSEMIKLPNLISMVKVRGAYASVGSDLPLYSYTPLYSQGSKWNGMTPLRFTGTLYDANLIEPPFSNSFEWGAEFGFLNNRIYLDIAKFNTVDGPQVFSLPISEASGFDQRQVSGREFERKGWEVSLNLDLIKKKNFSWSTAINWATMREYLKSVYGEEEKLGYIKVGERTDQYWGTAFEKSPQGEVVYNDNGFPKNDPYARFLGYIRPDWFGGITNTFRYKNMTLSASLDGRVGGTIFNNIEYNLWRSGRHPDSVTPEREDAVERGEKTMVGPGVIVTGGEINYDGEGNIISDTREFAPNTTALFYQDWARSFYPKTENMVMKKAFLKLREVVFTYSVPAPLLKRTPLQRADISLIGRNLFYWASTPFVDLDQYTNDESGSNLQTPSVRSYGFNINATF